MQQEGEIWRNQSDRKDEEYIAIHIPRLCQGWGGEGW